MTAPKSPSKKKSLVARFVSSARDLDSANLQRALIIRSRQVMTYQEKLSMQVIVSKKKRKPEKSFVRIVTRSSKKISAG